MIDFTDLYQELDQRSDEGHRFYHDIILNEEYKQAKHSDVHDFEIVIDIGSCMGEFAYYIYDQAKVIYAIEANGGNFNVLIGYIEKYHLDKIKPFHLAIAGSNGIRDLHSGGGCGGYSIITGSDFVEKVESKTISTFLAENNIESVDILKIDVECAEKEIFNASDFPEAAKKIKVIVGEVHGIDLSAEFSRNGFSYSLVGPDFIATRL